MCVQGSANRLGKLRDLGFIVCDAEFARPDRAVLEGVADVAREHVEMKVRVRVPVDLVVDLDRLEEFVDGPSGGHRVSEEG